MVKDDFLIAIPARLGSKRLPGKPLRKVAGIPLIVRVFRAAKKITNNVIVATDSSEVMDLIELEGGKAFLTPSELPSGTDRIAHVVKNMDVDYVVNVQGDEPFINEKHVFPVVESLRKGNEFATVAVRICDEKEINDPNVVKVVTDENGYALYFSRSSIPYCREGEGYYLKHIGIYGFTKKSLLEFVSWEQGKLEKLEGLEQLRILEKGRKIYVNIVSEYCIGIDTLDDLKRVEELLRGKSDGI